MPLPALLQDDERSKNPVDNYLLIVLAGILAVSLGLSAIKIFLICLAIFTTAFKYAIAGLLLLLIGIFLASG